MTQYTEQWAALDVIAERIRALGYPSPGTYSEFIKRASIKEVDGVPKATDMVRHLVKVQEATARTARKLFPLVDGANDQPAVTHDLHVSLMRPVPTGARCDLEARSALWKDAGFY